MSVRDSIPESSNWWDDAEFQNRLVALLIHDHKTLKSVSSLISADDFKPVKGSPNARARWLVAERALEYFENHGEPIGKLIRADVLEYASSSNIGANQIVEVKEYLQKLKSATLTAPDALVEKVVRFKGMILKKNAVQELAELLQSGQMTDEKWQEVSSKVSLINNGTNLSTVDYLATLENRISRRDGQFRRQHIPWTLIEPLDAMIHTVGRKQLGLILAPYKRGKSNFLLWIATSMALQWLNVLYVTLEDPRDVVEDRLDSIVTAVPLKSLKDKPNTLRRKFTRYKGWANAKIHVYDGTEGGCTVALLRKIINKCRDEGFFPDVLITDYDEEIHPTRNFREKRFEIDEVYRDYRALCAEENLIGWLAAQTQRNTRHLKILSGDKAAEDIGKARKVTCCISLGKGDWTDNSIYLWVAAHKTDRMEVGCEIVPDLERSLIYDRDATIRETKKNALNNPNTP